MAQHSTFKTSQPPLQDPPPNTLPAALLWCQKLYQSIQRLWNYVSSIDAVAKQNTEAINLNSQSIDELRAHGGNAALANLEKHYGSRITKLEKENESLDAVNSKTRKERDDALGEIGLLSEEQKLLKNANDRVSEQQRRLQDDFESFKNSMGHDADSNERLKNSENDISNLQYEINILRQKVLTRPIDKSVAKGALSNAPLSSTESASPVASPSAQRYSRNLGYNESQAPSNQPCSFIPHQERSPVQQPKVRAPTSTFDYRIRCGIDAEDTPGLVDDFAADTDELDQGVSLKLTNPAIERGGSDTEDELQRENTPQRLGAREKSSEQPMFLQDGSMSGHNVGRKSGRTRGRQPKSRSVDSPVKTQSQHQIQPRTKLPLRRTRNMHFGRNLVNSPSPLVQLSTTLRPEPQLQAPQSKVKSLDIQQPLSQHPLEDKHSSFVDAPPKKGYAATNTSRLAAQIARQNPHRMVKVWQSIEDPGDYVPTKFSKSCNHRSARTASRPCHIVKLQVSPSKLHEVLGDVPENSSAASKKRKRDAEARTSAPEKKKRRGRPPGRKSKRLA